MNLDKSKKFFEEANKYIPGGVNSPARAFKSVGGTPVFFDRAEGSILYDIDGNEFIDYVGSWGPMILGHAHPKVLKAISDAAQKTTSFGAPTEKEIKLAKLVTEMVPGIDKVRMVNSGTEACMSAIRLARGYTGKDKIIKFKGNYHGHGDSFLISAGSGALTLGTPSSPGVTKNTAIDTLVADYNNIDSVKKLVDENPGEIAAIMIEPVSGNMGVVPPTMEFLNQLKELCKQNDILLIFDEVMTGFRLAKGGAQELFNFEADIVTFGKIIGAGLPVGAFAAKEEIMNHLSPDGPVYQAGTLSGNPLAMSAGYALLSILNEDESIYTNLEKTTANLESGLREILTEKGIVHHINRVGSMISIFFTDEEVTDYTTAATTDKDLFKSYFHNMLERGIYLPPSPFESWFLSSKIDDSMINKTLEATKQSL